MTEYLFFTDINAPRLNYHPMYNEGQNDLVSDIPDHSSFAVGSITNDPNDTLSNVLNANSDVTQNSNISGGNTYGDDDKDWYYIGKPNFGGMDIEAYPFASGEINIR